MVYPPLKSAKRTGGKMTERKLWLIIFLTVWSVLMVTAFCYSAAPINIFLPARLMPKVPKPTYSVARTSPITVAEVFGRSQGCQEANPDLVQDTARTAVDTGLDPELFAAIVAVESACNQYAVSGKGAVGLTQVRVQVWSDTYDLADRYNLFNEQDNLKVGATILEHLVDQYGVREAVTRYQGLGQGDPGYTEKVLILARR
jgi:soluble lytic murein transglycosylase-like protein